VLFHQVRNSSIYQLQILFEMYICWFHGASQIGAEGAREGQGEFRPKCRARKADELSFNVFNLVAELVDRDVAPVAIDDLVFIGVVRIVADQTSVILSMGSARSLLEILRMVSSLCCRLRPKPSSLEIF